jgi:protein-S-isoprenylcysteine O-methyltransferase Ste14
MVFYKAFAFLGLMVVSASLLYGFRYDATAPALNYLINGGLFFVYMLVHFIMMTPGFKRLTSGSAAGSPLERRIYIFVSVITWLVVFYFHRPLPGPGMEFPDWATFLAMCAFLLSFFAFLEGGTFDSFGAFLAASDEDVSHGASAEAELNTTGSYASVRHPMYRGAFFMCIASILIHPNAAQAVWALLMASTWIAFIPVEERQLKRNKPEEYAAYMKVTQYRLLRGIW